MEHRDPRHRAIADQTVDDFLGFLVIRGTNIDHVRELRIAQKLGTGKGRDKRHAGLCGDRLRRCRGRRADRADQGKYLVAPDQPVGIGDRCFGLVAVVIGDQFELATVNAALAVDLGEGRHDATAHLAAPSSAAGPLSAADCPKTIRSADTPGTSCAAADPAASHRSAAIARRIRCCFITDAVPPAMSRVRRNCLADAAGRAHLPRYQWAKQIVY